MQSSPGWEPHHQSKTASSSSNQKRKALDDAPLPKEEKSKDKATTSSKLKTASKDLKTTTKKDKSPVEEKKSKDSIPGGFPGAFGDDEDMFSPASPDKVKKSTKVDAKPTKSKT